MPNRLRNKCCCCALLYSTLDAARHPSRGGAAACAGDHVAVANNENNAPITMTHGVFFGRLAQGNGAHARAKRWLDANVRKTITTIT
jgi:hypothetical protein